MLKMATRGQTWSDEEVLALLDIWSDETVQAELEGAYRNDHVFRRIVSELCTPGGQSHKYWIGQLQTGG